jgi:two-component system sensor histidine kinase KdpD
MLAGKQFADLGRGVGIVYMLPVTIAALRWGLVPALAASVASVGCSAFFFYPPIFSFEAHDWEQQVDLVLFSIIAIIVSQLATRLKRQAEIDRLREAMIGSVSHELRTPLASVMGALSVVSESSAVAADPRLSALSKMAREELERLNDDIQNLLDASRISAHGIQAKSEGVDLADVINAALDRRERKLSHHKLEIELPDEIPFTQGDPMLIEQAIAQVLDNAAKYAPRGSDIRLKVDVQRDDIVLTIADQGPGIAEHEQARVKERFFRGSRHTGTIPGSGLGLWIADAFIAACGGHLSVTSAGSGKGTTVTITLLASRPEPSEMENADE